jgi:GTP cyclohydrolase I
MSNDDENMGDESAAAILGQAWNLQTQEEKDEEARGLFTRLLQLIGEDPERGGLQETPGRAWRAWQDWTAGYGQQPENVLKVFEDGAELCGDELVLVKDIEFYSHCEHHLAPFFGVAHIAYIPSKVNPKVVGLSKLARLTDVYAKRLQVQERMTNQIANAINVNLEPLGVAVIVQAKHFCMCSRGVGKQGSTTMTSALRGVFKTKPEARAEFFSMALGQSR